LKGCKRISEEVIKKLNPKIKIEYPDYSDEKWSDPPMLIFRGPSLDRTDLISMFREIGGINLNHPWFTNNFT